VGSELRSINGKAVPKTFKQAMPILKELPLKLEFTKAVAEANYTVPAWLRAGLDEIGLVRRHEASKFRTFPRERSPSQWDQVQTLSFGQRQSLKQDPSRMSNPTNSSSTESLEREPEAAAAETETMEGLRKALREKDVLIEQLREQLRQCTVSEGVPPQ
jgi:hypothetical protein